MNTQKNNSNEEKISERRGQFVPNPKDVIASIVATVLLYLLNFLAGFFTNFSKILPDNKTMLLYGVIAAFVLVFLNYIINKFGIKCAYILKYISLSGIIGVSLVCFIHLLLIILEKASLDGNLYSDLEKYVQTEVLLVFLLCYMVIVYITINAKYLYFRNKDEKSNIENKLTENSSAMSSEIIGEFNAFSESIKDLLKKTEFDTAMTSTIIPFKIEKDKGIVKAYLITNNSYPDYTWMFPGGHIIFAENQSPESVAKSRAKDEAALDVTLVDLYDSYDLVSDIDIENQVSNMTIFNPPHYLYLFKLDDKAKCYNEKGHKYHIDAVYVGIIDKINSLNNDQHRLYIPLPIKLATSDEVNQACYKAVHSYYMKYHVKSAEQRNIPDYVEKMLYAAYKDLVTYIEKV